MSGLPGYDAWKTTEPEDLYDYEGPDDEEPEENSYGCTLCGGPLCVLGQLGNRQHYRCRNCGMDQSIEVPEVR